MKAKLPKSRTPAKLKLKPFVAPTVKLMRSEFFIKPVTTGGPYSEPHEQKAFMDFLQRQQNALSQREVVPHDIEVYRNRAKAEMESTEVGKRIWLLKQKVVMLAEKGDWQGTIDTQRLLQQTIDDTGYVEPEDARRVLVHASELEWLRAKGDLDRAVHVGMLLQESYTKLNLRPRERDAKKGRKQSVDTRKGADIKNSRYSSRNEDICKANLILLEKAVTDDRLDSSYRDSTATLAKQFYKLDGDEKSLTRGSIARIIRDKCKIDASYASKAQTLKEEAKKNNLA